VQPELVSPAPTLAPIVALNQPAARVRRVPWKLSQSPEFRRRFMTTGEAVLKYRMASSTVTQWIHQGRLSAVRAGLWWFIDRRELAAFIRQLPKPSTKARAKARKHQRMMRRRRLRRR